MAEDDSSSTRNLMAAIGSEDPGPVETGLTKLSTDILEELRGRDREFDQLVRRLRDEVEQGAQASLAELEALRVAVRRLEL